MSANTDRLRAIVEIHKGAADLALAEAEEAQTRLDAAIAQEAVDAAAVAAKAEKDAREAADAEAKRQAAADALAAADAAAVAAEAQTGPSNDMGPLQQSPEQLLAAEQAPMPDESDIPPATPAAVAHADELGVDLTQIEGSGTDGKILKADVAAAATEPEAAI